MKLNVFQAVTGLICWHERNASALRCNSGKCFWGKLKVVTRAPDQCFFNHQTPFILQEFPLAARAAAGVFQRAFND